MQIRAKRGRREASSPTLVQSSDASALVGAPCFLQLVLRQLKVQAWCNSFPITVHVSMRFKNVVIRQYQNLCHRQHRGEELQKTTGGSEEGGLHAFLPRAATLRIKCHACRWCWSSLLRTFILPLFLPNWSILFFRIFYTPFRYSPCTKSALTIWFGRHKKRRHQTQLRLEHVNRTKQR